MIRVGFVPCEEYPHGCITTDGQHYYQATAQPIGWVFLKRVAVEDRRSGDPKTWLREAWVTVHDEPPTVTRTPHYTAMPA